MSWIAKTRLFLDVPLSKGVNIPLSKDDSHYLVTVLRLKADVDIHVFNGRDGEWRCRLVEPHKKHALITAEEQTREQTPGPDVTVCFAPIKKTRIDFVAQKLTELGARRLIPIMTDHTNSGRVNTDRLLANAKEAAEQSGRLDVPVVHAPTTLRAVLDGWDAGVHILFCDEDLDGKPMTQALSAFKPGAPWAIFIGPEGGWSDAERKLLREHPLSVTVSLGPRVLRADTAAFAALTLWQSVLGDWGSTSTLKGE